MRCQRKNQFISWWTPFSALNAASQIILEHLPWFGRSYDLDSSSATWDLICPLFALLSMHLGNSLRGGIFRNITDPRVKVTPLTSDGDWQFLVCGLQHSLQIDFMPPPKKRSQVHMFGALTSESVFLKMEALVGWLSSLWPENHAVFNLLARDRNGMGCERKIRKKQYFLLCLISFFLVGREMP